MRINSSVVKRWGVPYRIYRKKHLITTPHGVVCRDKGLWTVMTYQSIMAVVKLSEAQQVAMPQINFSWPSLSSNFRMNNFTLTVRKAPQLADVVFHYDYGPTARRVNYNTVIEAVKGRLSLEDIHADVSVYGPNDSTHAVHLPPPTLMCSLDQLHSRIQGEPVVLSSLKRSTTGRYVIRLVQDLEKLGVPAVVRRRSGFGYSVTTRHKGVIVDKTDANSDEVHYETLLSRLCTARLVVQTCSKYVAVSVNTATKKDAVFNLLMPDNGILHRPNEYNRETYPIPAELAENYTSGKIPLWPIVEYVQEHYASPKLTEYCAWLNNEGCIGDGRIEE